MSDVEHHVSACPLCNGGEFKPYFLQLLKCGGCGLVLSPAIWQQEVTRQMETRWFGADYEPAPSIWVRAFEAWNNRETLERLARAQPPGRRLLEIGVGSGSFLRAARSDGYEVMGCDLSAVICERVQRLYGIAMHGEVLSTLGGDSRFDAIVMNHVLEHVQRPIEFLEDVCRLLVPGGRAHIAVPNVACWEARLSGWTSFEPYHLIYFEPRTLARAVCAGGLAFERMETRESFSGWFLALTRTVLGVNRVQGAVMRPVRCATGRAAWRRPRWLEHGYRIGMVSAGVGAWPLRWVQSRLGYGDEVICVARKPQDASVR